MFVFAGFFSLQISMASAAESVTLQDLQEFYLKGDYEKCIRHAEENLQQHQHSTYWRVILIEGYLAVGRVEEARAALESAMDRFSRSVALRWIRFKIASTKAFLPL